MSTFAAPTATGSRLTPASPNWPWPERYFPLSTQYRQRFGGKAYKVPLSVASTCPNREGAKGMTVCVFCDEYGSAAKPENAHLNLTDQIEANAQSLRAKHGPVALLAYFQAYTNTFGRLTQLEAHFEEALAHPQVQGLVVGTRPDCLPPKVVERLAEWAQRTFLSIEVGVQTLDEAQLAFLARGHTTASSQQAIARLKAHTGVDVCVHLMLGLPGETDAQLAQTARTLSEWGVDGVKLHNLHVLQNTPLAQTYASGGFTPISLPEYARRVGVFLEHLAPSVVVHRLAAVASRWEDVVAPDWAKQKLALAQAVKDHLQQVDTWQGRVYA